jgi:hypothetical protein
MSKIVFLINRWLVTLLSAFLVGLLLLSNHMSAMTMSLDHHGDEDTISQADVYPTSVGAEDEETHHASSESCCRECCPSCFLMAIQSVVDIPCGDKLKVLDSVPVFQIIFIKSIFPPPKA